MVQLGAAVGEAAGELPGVGLAFLLRLDLTRGIVVVGVVLVASAAVRQAHHRVEVVDTAILSYPPVQFLGIL